MSVSEEVIEDERFISEVAVQVDGLLDAMTSGTLEIDRSIAGALRATADQLAGIDVSGREDLQAARDTTCAQIRTILTQPSRCPNCAAPLAGPYCANCWTPVGYQGAHNGAHDAYPVMAYPSAPVKKSKAGKVVAACVLGAAALGAGLMVLGHHSRSAATANTAVETSLRTALTAEQTYYTQNQQFGPAGSLASIEPNLTWVDAPAVSTGPTTVMVSMISVTATNDTVLLTAASGDGRCFDVLQVSGANPAATAYYTAQAAGGSCAAPAVPDNVAPGSATAHPGQWTTSW